ncbi:ankyrin [Penaeus vannamei]|uniref:Ankyrin n=1 Tax=Penaeus vannamei TaxID=6689 RepID=A0A423T2G5_PENVA|nr:ankyrin [Penaeus vannamei]
MLIDAVKEGDCRSITVALNAGEEADGNPTAGKKPIHYAVESGSEEAVALLCDRGANLEVGNTENLGRKPLHMAVQRGNFEVVQTLLEKNADPNAKDDIGKTPLIIAAAGNAGHIASLLLDKGADVNIKDSDGGGLLHLAARTGSPYILEILKGKGCEMDGRDKEECTPLHRAAEYGNLEAVKWFVNNGSDFNAVDKSNLTPLQKAQKEEFVDVVHWMKEYKKNEAMNKIVKALRRGDQRAIEEKISEGFDVNTILQEENELGTLDGSPLHFAADEGHTSIAAFLLNHGPNVDCKNSKARRMFTRNWLAVAIGQYVGLWHADGSPDCRRGTLLTQAVNRPTSVVVKVIVAVWWSGLSYRLASSLIRRADLRCGRYTPASIVKAASSGFDTAYRSELHKSHQSHRIMFTEPRHFSTSPTSTPSAKHNPLVHSAIKAGGAALKAPQGYPLAAYRITKITIRSK